MRHHWTTRLLAAFMAVWLPLCLSDAGLVHVCPMHDSGLSMAGMSMAGMSVAGMSVGTMAGMAGMDRVAGALARHHDAPAQHSPANGQQHCMCMGPCTASAGLAPSAAVTLPAARVVASRRAPLACDVRAPAAAPQVRQPFAVGPPAGITV